MEITGLNQNYNIRPVKSTRQVSTPIDGPRDIAFGANVAKLTTRKGVFSGLQELGTTMKRKIASFVTNIESVFVGSPAHNIKTMTTSIKHSRKIQK